MFWTQHHLFLSHPFNECSSHDSSSEDEAQEPATHQEDVDSSKPSIGYFFEIMKAAHYKEKLLLVSKISLAWLLIVQVGPSPRHQPRVPIPGTSLESQSQAPA